MNTEPWNHIDTEAFCDLGDPEFEPKSATIVVFGASGDLSIRKIYPALYNLARTGLLPPESRIVGFARRDYDRQSFRAFFAEACRAHSRISPDSSAEAAAALEGLLERVDYVKGDLADPVAYERLAAALRVPGMPANILFYLAVGPDLFAPIAELIARAGLGSAGREPGPGEGERRLIVEKPFGTDRRSAASLSRHLQERFRERDIFRIDHYLGKEAVQNLLYLRFANAVFEPVWNRTHIESIQIDVFEQAGIGSRGGYYDGAGAARDMLQNHLIQLLCLTAMEPPSSLNPESIRDEKVKVLRAIPDYSPQELRRRSLRGQYTAPLALPPQGWKGPLRSYIEEERVAPGSRTETFAALSLELDNWRFSGVPITLRTGKAVDRSLSEIVVRFRRPPATLFAARCGDRLAANTLTVRIQPDTGVLLAFNGKVPGAPRVRMSELRFSDPASGSQAPEAYERLIADALAGDSTLFIRSDESDEAWRIVDRLEAAWAEDHAPLVLYPAGSQPLSLSAHEGRS